MTEWVPPAKERFPNSLLKKAIVAIFIVARDNNCRRVK